MSSQTLKVAVSSFIELFSKEAHLRTSKAYKKMERTECTLLKFINDLHQLHLPEAICRLKSIVFKKKSIVSSYTSHAFKLLKRISSGVQRYHHKLQGYVRGIMEKNEFTEAFTNQEVIFFLASVIITFPFMAAWFLYSSHSGSSEED
ncbi:hypothetical protein Taro_018696 [Colocasia esculenta]|uniref:Uncharacterized protein n=1 Tax=Colocasia esculenta TaxID=4460 RepID=A0A843UUG8_COLES|nr:hypothetical protein [Colocasia esculenta]